VKGQGAEVGGAREVSYRWALSALTVDGYADGSGGCADGRQIPRGGKPSPHGDGWASRLACCLSL
jgi:hypothetical protein